MSHILDDELTQALVAVGESLRAEGWNIEGSHDATTSPTGIFVTTLKENLAFLLDENVIRLLLNAKAEALLAEAVALKKIADPGWLDEE